MCKKVIKKNNKKNVIFHIKKISLNLKAFGLSHHIIFGHFRILRFFDNIIQFHPSKTITFHPSQRGQYECTPI